MDKLSKKIMKFMRTRGKNTEFTCSLDENWDYCCDCSLRELSQRIRNSEANTISAIKWLADEGWVEFDLLQDRGGEIAIGFHLSHKGLRQKEFNRMARIDFLKKSILTPIAVSFATSVIVSSLWPSLLRWLSGLLEQILQQL